MGLEILTQSDSGAERIPTSREEWDDWISATATRNFAIQDPVLDWLNRYGEAAGFNRDKAYPRYDSRTDFTEFIFAQGRRFEDAVVAHLQSLTTIDLIGGERGDARELSKAEATFAAMCEGVPIIAQAVLRDAEHRTYGLPDLLIRSDVLEHLFPGTLARDELGVSAPDLGSHDWHYRVVDIKFRALELLKNGELNNGGSAAAYKLQVAVYNRMLGRLQGYESPASYLLGRGWKQGEERGFSCMERLAPVPQMGRLAPKVPILDALEEALNWTRRVRTQGDGWEVLPDPSIPELYPNSGNDQDGPWHQAKRGILEELDDLTLLWFVGPSGRADAHAAGIRRWTDRDCTPALVGLKDQRAATLQAILDVNRDDDGPPVRPARVQAAEDEWRTPGSVEFYVDFETVSDLADDFSNIPERGGQPLIFMIGCGHVEDGEWRFASFVADRIAEAPEAAIIDEWLAHMADVRERLDPDGGVPMVIHWSPAEVSTLETAYNSAVERHPEKAWPSPRWFDFLGKVMRQEPVVIRGALGFGLKPVTKALHSHGLVETLWKDGPTDGLGAMVGAWWCEQESTEAETLQDHDLMSDIVRYNQVDCQVMMEVVRYLRDHH